ncbi:MAG TPA: MFS transporter, partial [Candidatus Limnocylindrales bacterium]|nr:MFS transporter [Candidatus Limnocylindrales bacterium]
VSGALAHRLGYARLFIGGALLFLLGVFGFAFAPAWPLLALAGIVTGLGSGSIDGGLNGYSAVNFNARVVNWMHAAFGIGITIAPLMLTAILVTLSWRVGYAATGLYLLVVLVLFVRSQRVWGWPPEPTQDAGETHTGSALNTLKSPLVWLSILLFLVYAGVESTPGQWTFQMFTETRGISVAAAGFWVSFYWFSFTIGRIVFGFLGNRWSPANVLRWGMIGLIFGAALYWFNPFDGLGGVIGLGIMGFTQAPMFPFLVLNTPILLGKARASHSIGFQVAGAGMGFAIMPSLAGVLAAQVGLAAVAPFVFGGAVLLLVLYELLNALAMPKARLRAAQSVE